MKKKFAIGKKKVIVSALRTLVAASLICLLGIGVASAKEMRTWLPENGQSHEMGHIDNSGGLDWISTWTMHNRDKAGSLLRTGPVSLKEGRYAVLFQVWHKQDDGEYLGELRAWKGDEMIARKDLISETFKSYRSGGYQRAVLKFDLPEDSSDLSFELWYGNNHLIWTGAVNVTAITDRRPFYNIGHRCSTMTKVNEMVMDHANAIECDITPELRDGEIVFYVYHSGDILYTKPEEFDAFLLNIKSHLDKRNIALVELDCKQDDSIAPAEYAKALASKLIEAGIPPELTVMSVPKAQSGIFASTLKGEDTFFDCGIDSYLEGYGSLTAEQWVKEVEVTGATFLGVGVFSLAPSPMPSWMSWIQEMTNRRDSEEKIKKAYFWTLNRRVSMRKCLDYGVDGIITNYPARLHEVLNEEPYRSMVRPATQEDSQFRVHK